MRIVCLLVVVAAGCAVGGAQPAASTTMEIQGRISKINLDSADGMPVMELKSSSGQVWLVRLGSIRYLIEQDFNPKAGQPVSAKVYEPGKKFSEVVAVSVTLKDSGQTVRLRDETGRPIWRCRLAKN